MKAAKLFFVQLDAAWAGFLHVGDHLAYARDEELGLNMAEDLEDVSDMT